MVGIKDLLKKIEYFWRIKVYATRDEWEYSHLGSHRVGLHV